MTLRFRSVAASAAASFAAIVLAPAAGCGATHICTLVGCVGSAAITYSKPISGTYTLDLKAGTVAATGVGCPSSRSVALADGASLACDAGGFTLSSFVTNGTDGGPLLPTLSVTITAAGVSRANDAAVATSVASTDFPNGPDCGGACYDLKGQVAITP